MLERNASIKMMMEMDVNEIIKCFSIFLIFTHKTKMDGQVQFVLAKSLFILLIVSKSNVLHVSFLKMIVGKIVQQILLLQNVERSLRDDVRHHAIKRNISKHYTILKKTNKFYSQC